MTVKVPHDGYLVALHGGDYLYAFPRGRRALADADALKRARAAAQKLANDTRMSVDLVAVGGRGQERYILDQIKPSRAHATKPPGVDSTKIDRASALIRDYKPWTSHYSNEDGDRASQLANALTDIDREEGRTAPPVGFSAKRYEQAKQVVSDTNRYGAKQQALASSKRSHATKKATSTRLPTVAFADTKLETWFERDRAHVDLRDRKTERTLIEFWDGDVSQLIEDGFLDRRNLHKSLYDYGVHLGAFKAK